MSHAATLSAMQAGTLLDSPPQRSLFELAGRHVLVLGLGESGEAMVRWVLYRGGRVRVADTRAEPPRLQGLLASLASPSSASPDQDAPIEFVGGAFDANLLEGIDLVAWSPGLSIECGDSAAFHRLALERGIAVVGEIELFANALANLREQGHEAKLIAITGTNGKTTTTALLGHLLERAGRRARTAGNIGPAALDALREALQADSLPDIWVLELSSFQLALTSSLRPDAATILNVTQDHLDWHESMDSYARAKHRLYARGTVAVFNRQDPATRPPVQQPRPRDAAPEHSFGIDEPPCAGDFGLSRVNGITWLCEAVANEDLPRRRRAAGQPPDPEAVLLKRLMPADALAVRGQHNQLNVLAALALARVCGAPMAPMLHALRDFQGQAHRCQTLMTLNEVDYIDDSKGTNVGATVAALDGLARRTVLIAGGDGKGQDFSPLREPVRRHCRAVVLIGRDGPRLGEVLKDALDGAALLSAGSLPEAVRIAAAQAQGGDAVLLSPACASLDMFRDYKHRADVFRDAVHELALEAGQPC